MRAHGFLLHALDFPLTVELLCGIGDGNGLGLVEHEVVLVELNGLLVVPFLFACLGLGRCGKQQGGKQGVYDELFH